jgi:hypothetical protein
LLGCAGKHHPAPIRWSHVCRRGVPCAHFAPFSAAVLTLVECTANERLASHTHHQKQRRQDPRLCPSRTVVGMRWEAPSSTDKVVPRLSARGDLCSFCNTSTAYVTLVECTANERLASHTHHQKRRRQDPRLCPSRTLVGMLWEAQSGTDKAVPGLSARGDLCSFCNTSTAYVTLVECTANERLASHTPHQKRRRQDPRLCPSRTLVGMRWEATSSNDKAVPRLWARGALYVILHPFQLHISHSSSALLTRG